MPNIEKTIVSKNSEITENKCVPTIPSGSRITAFTLSQFKHFQFQSACNQIWNIGDVYLKLWSFCYGYLNNLGILMIGMLLHDDHHSYFCTESSTNWISFLELKPHFWANHFHSVLLISLNSITQRMTLPVSHHATPAHSLTCIYSICGQFSFCKQTITAQRSVCIANM